MQLNTFKYNYLQFDTVNTVKLSASAASSGIRRTIHSTTAIQHSGVPNSSSRNRQIGAFKKSYK